MRGSRKVLPMPINILSPPLKCYHCNFVSSGQVLFPLLQQRTPPSPPFPCGQEASEVSTEQKRGLEKVHTVASHLSTRLLEKIRESHPLWLAKAILVEEKGNAFLSKELRRGLANGTWAEGQLSPIPRSWTHKLQCLWRPCLKKEKER